MKQESPMLMITLMIPLQADISSEQIIEVIGQQLSQAISAARQQQAEAEGLELADEEVQGGVRESVSPETFESYTEETKTDLLSTLGYSPSDE
jgi:hypothetical protein